MTLFLMIALKPIAALLLLLPGVFGAHVLRRIMPESRLKTLLLMPRFQRANAWFVRAEDRMIRYFWRAD